MDGMVDVTHLISGGFHVYALVHEGTCIYIGKTTLLAHRLYLHTRKLEFDQVFSVECESEQAMRGLEYRLIKQHKPLRNIGDREYEPDSPKRPNPFRSRVW